MAKVKTQSQVRKKKKIWLQINAPKLFGSKKIGETNVFFPENAIGKNVELNLMTLTGEMRKQNINMKFMIDDVQGNVASTKIISYKMVPSFIKRLVRRRKDKLEFSKVFITKDNVKIRVKPLIITSSKTRGSTQTALEKRSSQLIKEEVNKLTFNEFIDEVVSFKFQNNIKSGLKKIHPLKSFDLRQFIVLSEQEKDAFVSVDDETENNEVEEKSDKKEVKEEAKETKKEEKSEAKESKKEATEKKEVKEEVKETKKEEKSEAKESKKESSEKKEVKEEAKK